MFRIISAACASLLASSVFANANDIERRPAVVDGDSFNDGQHETLVRHGGIQESRRYALLMQLHFRMFLGGDWHISRLIV
jgi:hypothetical protein